ncbi:hypothetical protein COW20_11565 [bacterium (Candidatus Blackallbacteria) CG13_big_fil_rev_8_21_14_2_50_49_14]|nr:MAG: hypothetical protein COW20_11565 [bacterium (Candidatus Blackallbacteria) CG13_big_fil_rev_8_21_14_2_50_49_14]
MQNSGFLRFWGQGFWPAVGREDETRLKLAWLVILRWITVLVQAGAIALAAGLNLVLPEQVPVLAVFPLALFLANLWAARGLVQPVQAVQNAPARLLFWMLLDWVLFLMPISLVSGVHNPFFPLVFLHIALAAVLLPGLSSLLFLGIVLVSVYLLHPVIYLFGNAGYLRLSVFLATAIQSFVLLMVWGFVRWVSLRLEHYRQQWQALQQQQERLQRLQLLGALGAGVAHEFATPINTLRLRLSRLARQYEEEAMPPDLVVALQAQARCESKLRTLASLPSVESLSQQEPLALTPVIRQLIENWARRYPRLPLNLELELAPDFKLPLPELALRQALENLLDNAVQAAGLDKPVRVCLKQNLREIVLEICDQGPGWPEIVRKHLGEPFVTTRSEGTGLGLYMVYLLAQAQGGQLELRDQVPQGACARLSLPCV